MNIILDEQVEIDLEFLLLYSEYKGQLINIR